jgi:hypothetical protein
VKEVKRMVDKTIDPILANNVYDAKKVNEWSQSIIDGVLKNLAAASKPFKYVGTCLCAHHLSKLTLFSCSLLLCAPYLLLSRLTPLPTSLSLSLSLSPRLFTRFLQ